MNNPGASTSDADCGTSFHVFTVTDLGVKPEPVAPHLHHALRGGRSEFAPQSGSSDEWNAAYYRLEDYFRSLHLGNKIYQSQLILRLLQRAALKHATDPSQPPTSLVMEELYAASDRWFQQVLQKEDPYSRQGRLAFFINDATTAWPTLYLAEEISADCQKELQQSEVQAGPDLQVVSMVPRPLDESPFTEIELPETLKREFSFITALVIASIVIVFALVYFG